MISGFLFVVGASIVLSYLFLLFPINKLTTFLNPTGEAIYNKITITIIPLIIWSLIEFIVLGGNRYFVLGFLLNVFLNLSIMYVIKYGYLLINSKGSSFIDIVAIFISVFFGFLCNYLCLMVAGDKTIHILISLLGMILFIFIFVFIRLNPPKHEFFRGIEN